MTQNYNKTINFCWVAKTFYRTQKSWFVVEILKNYPFLTHLFFLPEAKLMPKRAGVEKGRQNINPFTFTWLLCKFEAILMSSTKIYWYVKEEICLKKVFFENVQIEYASCIWAAKKGRFTINRHQVFGVARDLVCKGKVCSCVRRVCAWPCLVWLLDALGRWVLSIQWCGEFLVLVRSHDLGYICRMMMCLEDFITPYISLL